MKMMKFFIRCYLNFFVLLCCSYSFGQTISAEKYSELKEFDLRGQVKQVINYIFENKIKNDLVRIPGQPINWTTKNIVSYDTNGNVGTIIGYDDKNTRTDSTIFFYNNATRQRSGKLYRDGALVNHYKRTWTGTLSYSDFIYNSGNKLLAEIKTNLDTNFRILSQRATYFDANNKLAGDEITVYKFTKAKYLEQIITTNSISKKEIYKTLNYDQDFDKQGNALKSSKQTYSPGQMKSREIVRMFIYY